jgi:hypothetical protein
MQDNGKRRERQRKEPGNYEQTGWVRTRLTKRSEADLAKPFIRLDIAKQRQA